MPVDAIVPLLLGGLVAMMVIVGSAVVVMVVLRGRKGAGPSPDA